MQTSTPNEKELHDIEFVVVSYNIHSMMRFEERAEHLLQELDEVHWDILVITETWREESRESWQTPEGHTWFGSGGHRRHSGVGFLVHSRWDNFEFHHLSDRLAYLDVHTKRQTVMRIHAVYMPHSGQSEEEVEAVYSSLSKHLIDAKGRRCINIIAGDFNADVGVRQDEDDPAVIGAGPARSRCSRGAMLVQWCMFHNMVLTNTHSNNDSSTSWTYRNGELLKILDYVITEQNPRCKVLFSHVLNRIPVQTTVRLLRDYTFKIHIPDDQRIGRKDSKKIARHLQRVLKIFS